MYSIHPFLLLTFLYFSLWITSILLGKPPNTFLRILKSILSFLLSPSYQWREGWEVKGTKISNHAHNLQTMSIMTISAFHVISLQLHKRKLSWVCCRIYWLEFHFLFKLIPNVKIYWDSALTLSYLKLLSQGTCSIFKFWANITLSTNIKLKDRCWKTFLPISSWYMLNTTSRLISSQSTVSYYLIEEIWD